MMQKKQKLIVPSKKITIDPPKYNESDIEDEEHSYSIVCTKTKMISHICNSNLLGSVVLKKRV